MRGLYGVVPLHHFACLADATADELLGVIHSELRRYIKRNSDVSDYRNDAADLFDHLRARGYHPRFLRRAFDQAPSWLSRHELLSARSVSDGDSRIHTFKLAYSRELAQLGLGDLLHRHEHLLPSYIAKKKVVCWRAAPKLGRALIPYRYGEKYFFLKGMSCPWGPMEIWWSERWVWWGRGGGRKLKSDSASIEHIDGWWGGLGHEQFGLKV